MLLTKRISIIAINTITPTLISFLYFDLNSLQFILEKFIVIKRTTDKILKVIETLHQKNLEDTTIVLNSDNLEKKSKLRSFFEKDKKLVCVPFYPDNNQTLSKLAYNFLNDKKISISTSNMNLIVGKCNGDREALINELQKIEYFGKNGKKINKFSYLLGLRMENTNIIIDQKTTSDFKEKKYTNFFFKNTEPRPVIFIYALTFISLAIIIVIKLHLIV